MPTPGTQGVRDTCIVALTLAKIAELEETHRQQCKGCVNNEANQLGHSCLAVSLGEDFLVARESVTPYTVAGLMHEMWGAMKCKDTMGDITTPSADEEESLRKQVLLRRGSPFSMVGDLDETKSSLWMLAQFVLLNRQKAADNTTDTSTTTTATATTSNNSNNNNNNSTSTVSSDTPNTRQPQEAFRKTPAAPAPIRPTTLNAALIGCFTKSTASTHANLPMTAPAAGSSKKKTAALVQEGWGMDDDDTDALGNLLVDYVVPWRHHHMPCWTPTGMLHPHRNI